MKRFAKIYLTNTNKEFTIVDKKDHKYLSQWTWHKDNKGYAIRRQKHNEKLIGIHIHRLINKTPKNLLTDHINRNKLDNRKCNLRSVTFSENARNCDITNSNKSGFRGVHFSKAKERWRAATKINYKQVHIGYFDTPRKASKAYKNFWSKRKVVV